jgi:hypothetical protein
MNWDWVKTLNTTSYKAVIVMWLWIGTGVVIGAVIVIATMRKESTPPETLIALWLGALTTLSGVGAYTYKTMRDTDYGALERKAAANVPTSTTTASAGGVVVQQAPAPAVIDLSPPAPMRASGSHDPGA